MATDRTVLTPDSAKRDRDFLSPETPVVTTPTSTDKGRYYLSQVKRFDSMILVEAASPQSDDTSPKVKKKRVVRRGLGYYAVQSPPAKGSNAWFAERTQATKVPTEADWREKLLLTLEKGGGALEPHEVVVDKLLSFKRDLLTLQSKLRACGATALANRLSKFYKKNNDKSGEEIFERAKIFALQLRHENNTPHMNVIIRVKKFHLKNSLTAEMIKDADFLRDYHQKITALISSVPEDFFPHIRQLLQDERTQVSDRLDSFTTFNEALASIEPLQKEITLLQKECEDPLTQPASPQSRKLYEIKVEERTRQENKLSFLKEELEEVQKQCLLHKKTFLGLKASHSNNWKRIDECLLRLTNPPVQVAPPPQHQLLKPPTFLEYFIKIKSEIEEGILAFSKKEIKDTGVIQSFISEKIRALQQLMETVPAEKTKVKNALQNYAEFVEGLYEKAQSIRESEELLQMYSHHLCAPTNTAASAQPVI